MTISYSSKLRERLETITYSPGLQDSGDLEAGTKSITATSEASGTGNADYNAALTIGASPDPRLVVKQICARLAVTIDSMTAGTLNIRVYVDAQDGSHLLFDESEGSTGAKLYADITNASAKTTIFNLLKDGASHTFYFFFWVDAGDAVLSVVQLWEAVGSNKTSSVFDSVLDLDFNGMVGIAISSNRQGTGTATTIVAIQAGANWLGIAKASSAGGLSLRVPSTVSPDLTVSTGGSVSTDLDYISRIELALRSLS